MFKIEFVFSKVFVKSKSLFYTILVVLCVNWKLFFEGRWIFFPFKHEILRKIAKDFKKIYCMHSVITWAQSINFWPSFSWETYTNRKNILLLTVHSSSRQVARIPNRGWLCKTVYPGHEEFSCHFIQKRGNSFGFWQKNGTSIALKCVSVEEKGWKEQLVDGMKIFFLD